MDAIAYGGDWNPEQWDEETNRRDTERMVRAGVNLISLGIFSWASLEPEEGHYDLEWLADLIDQLHNAGIGVDLANGTASPPAWMAQRYPQTLPVDSRGVRLGFGSRQQYNPSSELFCRKACELTEAMARRFGDHPGVVMWHISNEYACHTAESFDDESAAAFRRWLMEKYGDIQAINLAWGTAFWSQTYRDIQEIQPPRAMPTFYNPGQMLDWRRFSDYALRSQMERPEDGTATELLEQIAAERDALVKAKKLKKQKPLPPITDEDRPFPIPSNWVWARFGEVARYAQRGKSPTYADISPYSAVSQKCVRWTGFDPALARPYAPEAFATLPQDRILSAGDILWNSTGTGTVGRSTVLPESGDFGKMAADSHVTVIRTFPEVLPRFVDIFISSPHIQQNMDDLTSGTTKQQELNLGTILELPLPIPPLPEQERIVAKLDEVLPLIDQLAELERERESI